MPLTTDLTTHLLSNPELFELRLGKGPVLESCDRIDAKQLNEDHAIYAQARYFEGLTGFLAECQKGTQSRKLGMPRPPAPGDVVIVSSDRGVSGLLPPYMHMEVAFVIQENGELRAIALDNYYDDIFPPKLVAIRRGDRKLVRQGYVNEITGAFTPWSKSLEVPV